MHKHTADILELNLYTDKICSVMRIVISVNELNVWKFA